MVEGRTGSVAYAPTGARPGHPHEVVEEDGIRICSDALVEVGGIVGMSALMQQLAGRLSIRRVARGTWLLPNVPSMDTVPIAAEGSRTA